MDGDQGVVALRRRASGALHRRPVLRGGLLLAPPTAWFLVLYVGALVALFVSAFWQIDDFTGATVHAWTFDNFHTLLSDPVYRTVALRTIKIAAAVTVTDALLALPFAYYAARIASRRTSSILFVAVLLPLWSSYLVRVYAWRLILAKDGVLNWALDGIGLGSLNVAYSNWAMWIVFSYIWLPYMIVPIFGAMERIPSSIIEASADLGAKSWTTTAKVLFPMALPGIIAGSIFTFALTLGDFISPILVGGAHSTFIGNVIYDNIGTANNLPFAAALAIVPIAIMTIYLLGARFLGAFEAL